MNIYKKILQFVKPFWKHIILSMLLTFIYVMLNNVSLWVTVDFIGELFPTGGTKTETVGESISGLINHAAGTDSENTKTVQDSLIITGAQAKKPSLDLNIYHRIKKAVKNVLIRDNQRDTLQLVCIVIFITFILKNIFDYLRRIINRWIQLRVVVDLRNQLQATAMRLPLGYFNTSHSGRLTSIVFNDVKAIRQVLNNSFGKMILTPIQMLANIFILVIISWKLSIITFLVIPISGLIIVKIGQSMRRKSRRVLKQISEVMMLFQEAVSSIQVVKAFTSEEAETRKFQEANRNFFSKQVRAYRLGQATSPLNEITAVTILITLLWYGGNLVYKGEMGAEDFVRYLIFLFASLQPLRELSGLNNIIQRGVAAAERIFNIIDEPQEIYVKPGDKELTDFKHSIELDNVSFNYHEDGPAILHSIDLKILKGETVAFVGHSGSGKTTLVNLIPRFYGIDNGIIRLDRIDTKDYSLTSLRRQIGIVTQETFLFNDSIRHNIAYGMPDVSDQQIIDAARAANAWEFINAMKEGLDSIVGERGANLSGGQRQRLSIARAILKNPPILILDEATSALDTESEKLVQDAIDTIMENRTVLIIAHRLSTVIHADKIVVLSNGKIVDIGKHVDLLKSCSMYKKLYDIQFRDDVDVPA
ncbi:ABC transporter ATP-binding protein [bacterium]|nr:ABC transporter ATP-binding protein [bacterium]